MQFPDENVLAEVLASASLPRFASVRYDPETPELADVPDATRAALDSLAFDALDEAATVAVGLGSRGIHDIETVARTVVDDLRDRGFEPVVVPAMGSHGGATDEGQRRTLAGIGLTEEALARDPPPDVSVEEWCRLRFEDGGPVFEPVD